MFLSRAQKRKNIDPSKKERQQQLIEIKIFLKALKFDFQDSGLESVGQFTITLILNRSRILDSGVLNANFLE